VAFGGGVVGDLAGFLAATYLRGVPFIQVPTTLLAQVDSSVGGKVGIDLPEGKNLVGAFYPPTSVQIPLECLHTLPERELRNGSAEVLKYGLIQDAALWHELEEPLGVGTPRLETVVRRCIELKAEVVAEDELETTGRRAILNFGHTIGHALEHRYEYGTLLHGEAISVGMVAEARLGELLGMTPAGTAVAIAKRFEAWGLPTTDPALQEPDSLIDAMRGDKKAQDGRLAFSLLEGIGACKLVEQVDEQVVRRALAES
jgi:3-dehydroquinate synthase